MKRFFSWFLLFILVITTVFSGSSVLTDQVEVAAAQTYRNVMYYGEWSIYAGQHNYTPDKIPGNYITHLNFAFLDVDQDGNVISCDTWADFENPKVGYSATSGDPWAGVVAAMLQLRNQYPNMKIGFSVGGWTRSGDFPKVAASAAARKNFAENIARTAHLYGYDFVDIDWEYPTADRDPDPDGNGVSVDKGCKGSAEDKQNFTLLLQDIRAALDKYDKLDNKHYELSVAMSASPAMMAQIEYDKVLQIVDFANMMTYDLQGAWSAYTGHQTALYTNDAYDHESQPECSFSVDACVRYLYDTYGDSIDASKIVIGVAPYTRGWGGVKNDGRDPQNPGLFATAEPNSVKGSDGASGGTFAYSDIGALIEQYGLTEYYDEKADAAYYYSKDQGYFFTCDNSRSVTAKANYVKNTNGYENPFHKPLGGLISWMASLDAASEITKTSHDALFGEGTELPKQEIKFPAMENISSTVSASGNQYIITIKNNNTVSTAKDQGTLHAEAEANILYYAETFAGTATYPVYYIKTADGSALTGSAWEAGGTVGRSGDYTTVTMTAWPYCLKPGETVTLTLTSSGEADVSNITEVGLTRRINADGAELGWTNVIGNAEPPATTEPPKEDDETGNKPPEEKPTGSYEPWVSGKGYNVGDLVSYQDKVYECINAHSSNDAWTPDSAFTLWKERTDLVNAPGNPGEKPDNPGDNQPDTSYYVNGKLPQHMVTGYWHNFENGSANLKLGDVPSYYDMICVAFTGNTTTPGEVTFELDGDLSRDLDYSKEDFIQDIKNLQEKGQHVIVSVGGAEGRIEINSEEAAGRFAAGLIDIIEEYGFEGVDIDLEGSAVSGVDYIAEALREVYDHFNDKDFIITMAPETYYIQAGSLAANDITTSYLRLALKIKDILTICYPQFYNSGGMNGYGGSIVNPGNADFLTSLSTLVIEAGLRADQVAMGVPSTQQAGSGYVSPDTLKTAVYSMINGTSSGSFTPPKAYPTFRGVMTWSINWDATNDYAWAKAMDQAMQELPVVDSGSTDPSGGTTEDKPDIPDHPGDDSDVSDSSGGSEDEGINQQPQAPNGNGKQDVQPVTGIKLVGISKKIAAGKKIQLREEVSPENATDKTVIWSSSNTKYATVDAAGKVSVKKKGKNKTVIITATSADGNTKATYKIKIMPKAVKSISLKASATSVKAGKKVKIKAAVTPSNKKQANTKLQWSSSNVAYAAVDKKGIVTTKKAGKGKTVKITAKATDGSNKKKTIKIKIQ